MSCDDLQKQIDDLKSEINKQQKHIDSLEQKLVLLTKELDTIRFEGCWRYHQDSNHGHKK